MTREMILKKIKKLSELAERGIDGERENAKELLKQLREKYEIESKDVEDEEEKYHSWKYKDGYEKELLSWIFFKVIGVDETYVPIRYATQKKEIGCYCTEWEYDEICFLYNFYIDYFRKELKDFVVAFARAQKLLPDESSRKWELHKKEMDKLMIESEKGKGKYFKTEREIEEEKRSWKIANWTSVMEKKSPVRIGIEGE